MIHVTITAENWARLFYDFLHFKGCPFTKPQFSQGALSTEFIFFNFSDIATYPRKLGNQNYKLLIFQRLLSENSQSKLLWKVEKLISPISY